MIRAILLLVLLAGCGAEPVARVPHPERGLAMYFGTSAVSSDLDLTIDLARFERASNQLAISARLNP